MGVSLENLFSANRSIQNTQAGTGGQAIQSAANKVLQNIFSTGDVISGKVSSLQGSVVELLLPNGESLSAVLGQNVQVNLGEQMMFAIKSMSQGQIELNPLFQNTANTSTIMKALDGAGLPVNEQNVAMVENMMERGMSIQKDALLSMKRSVAQFPGAPVEDVVTLHTLKMPVNESNLTQLQAYKNSENQIMRPIMDMLSEVPNTFDMLLNQGETGKAVNLYNDLVQLFCEMTEETTGKSEGMTQNTENVNKADTTPENLHLNKETELLETSNQDTMGKIPAEGSNLSENTTTQIKQLFAKLGLENEQIEAVLKGNPGKTELLQTIGKQLAGQTGITEEKLAEIFKEPFFKELLSSALKEVSTLSPKEVADYENIDKLYEHLQKRADKILETLSGKEDFALAKGAQNLKANVDFMNQMNQMFQYVQLPLKFTEGGANGELYVYGNGKKLSLEDGNVSALLHLDMEHLGTVDIHVEMNPEKQVKTNFYFEDEAMLDFVYEHIDMLNERLEKRGYGPVTNVQMRDETTKTPVAEIFEKKEETPVLLRTQSFDARI